MNETTDTKTIRLFKIEDGETHHVAAYDHEDAIQLLAEMCGETVAEYREDNDPSIEWADMTKPLKIRVTDDVQYDFSGWPKGSHLEAHVFVPPGKFSQFKRGMVCSTVW